LSNIQIFTAGQRWVSSMEPELGLGLIIKADNRVIEVRYPAAETNRTYAAGSPPLKRVEFQPGDTIQTIDEKKLIITAVSDEDGLLMYTDGVITVPESQLISVQSAASALPRLLSGHYDFPRLFSLRYKTLKRRSEWLNSQARGFEGCRVSLIPHQLDVAYETATRSMPRVLLADEVGLGKTIEAGLILHRLLLTGQAVRVLIIVPEGLTVQWFIELYRRFNLSFTLVGDHPLKAEFNIEPDIDENSAFEPSLCLASLEGLLSHPKWITASLEASWDIVVFDEAHHLSEKPHAYRLAEALAIRSPGLLLLTATPESVGTEAHFKRLRLLDPARYSDFKTFMEQRQKFQPIADLAARLLDHQTISAEDKLKLQNLDIEIKKDHFQIVRNLVDRHGEGRVIFRNTRAHIPGFPQREINLYPLKASETIRTAIDKEVISDLKGKDYKPNYNDDPRLSWLITWLKDNPGKKALLICTSFRKAINLAAVLEKQISFKAALFHEQMTLLQRDRQAAWFASSSGTRLLIASEIGGEGRNFQFAQHLIFFDYPSNPDKIEQRIGRLDRIGQRDIIHLHLPYIEETGQEIIVLWLNNGLNGFQKTISGGYSLYLKFKKPLEDLLKGKGQTSRKIFLENVKKEADRTAKIIHEGRDRLLELGSNRPERARQLHESMEEMDTNPKFRKWTRRLLDHFGIKADPLRLDTWQLDFELLNTPTLPLPRGHEKGVTATFNRNLAQDRENWVFLTSEHPLIEAASSLLLESESGNACLASLSEPGFVGMVLETVFVLECLTPPRLFIDRFLPPTPLHGFIDHKLENLQDGFPTAWLKRLRPYPDQKLSDQRLRDRIKEMASAAQNHAEKNSGKIRTAALGKMKINLDAEINRLISLSRINPAVRREEIDILIKEKEELLTAIKESRLRLDAIRLILPLQ